MVIKIAGLTGCSRMVSNDETATCFAFALQKNVARSIFADCSYAVVFSKHFRVKLLHDYFPNSLLFLAVPQMFDEFSSTML